MGFLQQFNEDELLATIQDDNFEQKIHGFALQLAMLGLIDRATDILRLFPDFDPHSAAVEWKFAWTASGHELAKDLQFPPASKLLETAKSVCFTDPQWSFESAEHDLKRLSAVALNKTFSPTDTERPLVACLFLAHHLEDEALVDLVLLHIAARIHSQQMQRYLLHFSPVWSRLASGWLRNCLCLSVEELDEFADLIQGTTQTRLRFGPRHADDLYARSSIADLLETINSNTMGDSAFVAEQLEDYTSIFREPASPEVILAAEERLGVELPGDCKELLAISNGLENHRVAATSLGSTYVGCVEEYAIDDELLPDAWKNQFKLKLVRGMSGVRWPVLSRGINLAAITHPSEALWLLYPEDVQQAREAFRKLYCTLSVLERDTVDRQIREQYGSEKAFEGMTYCIALGDAEAEIDDDRLRIWPSYKSFLCSLASESRLFEDESPLAAPRVMTDFYTGVE